MIAPKVWSDPSTGERVIAARPSQVVMGDTSHLRHEIREIGGKLAEAGERMQAMEAALLPFSNVDGEGSEDEPDSTPVVVEFGRTKFYALRLGDFRRARAAMKGVAP